MGLAAAIWIAPAGPGPGGPGERHLQRGVRGRGDHPFRADAAEQGRVRPRRAQAEGAPRTRFPGHGKIQPALQELLGERRPAPADRGRREVPRPDDGAEVADAGARRGSREPAQPGAAEASRRASSANIKGERAEELQAARGRSSRSSAARCSDTYWLIQGAHVSLPLGSVPRARRPPTRSRYLELADGVAKPPADANPDNDLIDARAQILSDPYFNLGQTSRVDRPVRHRRA